MFCLQFQGAVFKTSPKLPDPVDLLDYFAPVLPDLTRIMWCSSEVRENHMSSRG